MVVYEGNDNVLTQRKKEYYSKCKKRYKQFGTRTVRRNKMAGNLSVVMAPKDTTFQVRINSEIKKTVEEIYARTGMTLTDAFNTFIQQSINVEGLPFLVT